MEYIYQKTMYGNSIAMLVLRHRACGFALCHTTPNTRTHTTQKKCKQNPFCSFFLSDASTLVLNFVAANGHNGDKKEKLIKAHWRVESRSMEHWSVMI